MINNTRINQCILPNREKKMKEKPNISAIVTQNGQSGRNETLQNSGWTLFGAFANLRRLTQIPYSQEYVDLRQTPHLGKIIQKSPEPGILQLSLMDTIDPICPFLSNLSMFFNQIKILFLKILF